MALPATHFRFALEMMPRLQISAPRAYLSGTLYPDSRWFTGADREKTHTMPSLTRPGGSGSDFTAGWHIHCLCDRIQAEAVGRLFPQWKSLEKTEAWLHLSAVKMIQDSRDLLQFDMDRCLAALDDLRAPCGESPGEIARFYAVITRHYEGCQAMSPAAYSRLWTAIGLDGKLVKELEGHMQKLLEDNRCQATFANLYDDMKGCLPEGYPVSI